MEQSKTLCQRLSDLQVNKEIQRLFQAGNNKKHDIYQHEGAEKRQSLLLQGSSVQAGRRQSVLRKVDKGKSCSQIIPTDQEIVIA